MRIVGVTDGKKRLPWYVMIRLALKMLASSAVASNRSRKLSFCQKISITPQETETRNTDPVDFVFPLFLVCIRVQGMGMPLDTQYKMLMFAVYGSLAPPAM